MRLTAKAALVLSFIDDFIDLSILFIPPGLSLQDSNIIGSVLRLSFALFKNSIVLLIISLASTYLPSSNSSDAWLLNSLALSK